MFHLSKGDEGIWIDSERLQSGGNLYDREFVVNEDHTFDRSDSFHFKRSNFFTTQDFKGSSSQDGFKQTLTSNPAIESY